MSHYYGTDELIRQFATTGVHIASAVEQADATLEQIAAELTEVSRGPLTELVGGLTVAFGLAVRVAAYERSERADVPMDAAIEQVRSQIMTAVDNWLANRRPPA